jgi:hypothetical protein
MREARRKRLVRSDDGTAFFPDPGQGPAVAPDDLAEELAEEFLASALAGHGQAADAYDQIVDEEEGGPFITSPDRREFARGGDEDDECEAEAFPTSSSAPLSAKPRVKLD